MIRKERLCLALEFGAEYSSLGRSWDRWVPGLPQTSGGLKLRQLQFSGLHLHFSIQGFASTSRKRSKGWGGGDRVALTLDHSLTSPSTSMPKCRAVWKSIGSRLLKDWVFFFFLFFNLIGKDGGERGKAWEWAKDFKSAPE